MAGKLARTHKVGGGNKVNRKITKGKRTGKVSKPTAR